MASRFSVNKAGPSVFISADDVRDDGASSSPGPTTADGSRLSSGSAGKPSSSADAANDEAITVNAAADDHEGGNE